MSNTRSSLLPDRAVIAVSGEDAREFLQGLITNDIYKVTPAVAVFAAILSPQGKFLHDFFIIEHEGRLLLETAKANLPDLIKRLSMYKLRSKVEIAEMPGMRVGAEWGSGVEAMVKYQDPRLPELGIRAIGADLKAEDTGEYTLHRLNWAVPEGSVDLTCNRSFPMQWAYDKLHAIDFDKGCYVGQEVTARSKHLGTLRKLVHKVEANTALPVKDTPIMAGESEVGTIAGSAGNIGLAILNIDAVNSGALLTSNGIEIKASLPVWAATP